ncbi:TPA: hypothetical protein MFN31_004485 [Klebsiella pneumoniae]|nr:hypothetical protein [Klebsiella pneumoniae]
MCAPPLHNHPPRRVIPGLAVKFMLKTDDSVTFIIVIILYYYSVRKIEVCYVHSPCH